MFDGSSVSQKDREVKKTGFIYFTTNAGSECFIPISELIGWPHMNSSKMNRLLLMEKKPCTSWDGTVFTVFIGFLYILRGLFGISEASTVVTWRTADSPPPSPQFRTPAPRATTFFKAPQSSTPGDEGVDHQVDRLKTRRYPTIYKLLGDINWMMMIPNLHIGKWLEINNFHPSSKLVVWGSR